MTAFRLLAAVLLISACLGTVPSPAAAGAVGGAVFTWHPARRESIRERRRAEALRHASQTMLGEALEAISEGFVLYDKDGRLVVCNTKFRNF